MKKHGVIVDCKHCRCASSDGCGSFDVTVPVSDSETGIAGTAKLHCVVSPEHHWVELREWHDAGFRPISPSGKIQQRVSAALGLVAEYRICGNRHICPSEVIRIVEEHGSH